MVATVTTTTRTHTRLPATGSPRLPVTAHLYARCYAFTRLHILPRFTVLRIAVCTFATVTPVCCWVATLLRRLRLRITSRFTVAVHLHSHLRYGLFTGSVGFVTGWFNALRFTAAPHTRVYAAAGCWLPHAARCGYRCVGSHLTTVPLTYTYRPLRFYLPGSGSYRFIHHTVAVYWLFRCRGYHAAAGSSRRLFYTAPYVYALPVPAWFCARSSAASSGFCCYHTPGSRSFHHIFSSACRLVIRLVLPLPLLLPVLHSSTQFTCRYPYTRLRATTHCHHTLYAVVLPAIRRLAYRSSPHRYYFTGSPTTFCLPHGFLHLYLVTTATTTTAGSYICGCRSHAFGYAVAVLHAHTRTPAGYGHVYYYTRCLWITAHLPATHVLTVAVTVRGYALYTVTAHIVHTPPGCYRSTAVAVYAYIHTHGCCSFCRLYGWFGWLLRLPRLVTFTLLVRFPVTRFATLQFGLRFRWTTLVGLRTLLPRFMRFTRVAFTVRRCHYACIPPHFTLQFYVCVHTYTIHLPHRGLRFCARLAFIRFTLRLVVTTACGCAFSAHLPPAPALCVTVTATRVLHTLRFVPVTHLATHTAVGFRLPGYTPTLVLVLHTLPRFVPHCGYAHPVGLPCRFTTFRFAGYLRSGWFAFALRLRLPAVGSFAFTAVAFVYTTTAPHLAVTHVYGLYAVYAPYGYSSRTYRAHTAHICAFTHTPFTLPHAVTLVAVGLYTRLHTLRLTHSLRIRFCARVSLRCMPVGLPLPDFGLQFRLYTRSLPHTRFCSPLHMRLHYRFGYAVTVYILPVHTRVCPFTVVRVAFYHVHAFGYTPHSLHAFRPYLRFAYTLPVTFAWFAGYGSFSWLHTLLLQFDGSAMLWFPGYHFTHAYGSFTYAVRLRSIVCGYHTMPYLPLHLPFHRTTLHALHYLRSCAVRTPAVLHLCSYCVLRFCYACSSLPFTLRLHARTHRVATHVAAFGCGWLHTVLVGLRLVTFLVRLVVPPGCAFTTHTGCTHARLRVHAQLLRTLLLVVMRAVRLRTFAHVHGYTCVCAVTYGYRFQFVVRLTVTVSSCCAVYSLFTGYGACYAVTAVLAPFRFTAHTCGCMPPVTVRSVTCHRLLSSHTRGSHALFIPTGCTHSSPPFLVPTTPAFTTVRLPFTALLLPPHGLRGWFRSTYYARFAAFGLPRFLVAVHTFWLYIPFYGCYTGSYTRGLFFLPRPGCLVLRLYIAAHGCILLRFCWFFTVTVHAVRYTVATLFCLCTFCTRLPPTPAVPLVTTHTRARLPLVLQFATRYQFAYVYGSQLHPAGYAISQPAADAVTHRLRTGSYAVTLRSRYAFAAGLVLRFGYVLPVVCSTHTAHSHVLPHCGLVLLPLPPLLRCRSHTVCCARAVPPVAAVLPSFCGYLRLPPPLVAFTAVACTGLPVLGSCYPFAVTGYYRSATLHGLPYAFGSTTLLPFGYVGYIQFARLPFAAPHAVRLPFPTRLLRSSVVTHVLGFFTVAHHGYAPHAFTATTLLPRFAHRFATLWILRCARLHAVTLVTVHTYTFGLWLPVTALLVTAVTVLRLLRSFGYAWLVACLPLRLLPFVVLRSRLHLHTRAGSAGYVLPTVHYTHGLICRLFMPHRTCGCTFTRLRLVRVLRVLVLIATHTFTTRFTPFLPRLRFPFCRTAAVTVAVAVVCIHTRCIRGLRTHAPLPFTTTHTAVGYTRCATRSAYTHTLLLLHYSTARSAFAPYTVTPVYRHVLPCTAAHGYARCSSHSC